MQQRFEIGLTLDSVSLSRGEQILIENLSLNVTSGNMLWLTGANGIGKTTLLLACAGLLSPDFGTIAWRKGSEQLSAKDALSYAAHNGPERTGLTLGEELGFWQTLSQDRLPLSARLEQVGLEGRDKTPVAGLSAGQRRRLSLARLLIADRPAWLMDEPLSGLDREGQDLVTQHLSEHVASGGLVLIASHHPVPLKSVEAQKLVLEPAS